MLMLHNLAHDWRGTVFVGAVPAPEDPALKKEVELLHRREEELTARLAALDAELATARSSKADLMAQVAELKRSVQVSSLLET